MYVGYYLHWPLTEILELSHRDRTAVIAEIGGINRTYGLRDRGEEQT